MFVDTPETRPDVALTLELLIDPRRFHAPRIVLHHNAALRGKAADMHTRRTPSIRVSNCCGYQQCQQVPYPYTYFGLRIDYSCSSSSSSLLQQLLYAGRCTWVSHRLSCTAQLQQRAVVPCQTKCQSSTCCNYYCLRRLWRRPRITALNAQIQLDTRTLPECWVLSMPLWVRCNDV